MFLTLIDMLMDLIQKDSKQVDDLPTMPNREEVIRKKFAGVIEARARQQRGAQ